MLTIALLPSAVLADYEFSVDVASIDGDSWTLIDASVTLSVDDAATLSASVVINEARFPEPIGVLRNLVVSCPDIQIGKGVYRCERATLVVADSPLEADSFSARLAYDPATTSVWLASDDLPFAGTRMQLDAEWAPSGWRADLRAKTVEIGRLRSAASDFMSLPADLELGGEVDFELDYRATAAGETRIALMAATDSLFLANEAGTLAAEGLEVSSRLNISQQGEGQPWSIEVSAESAQGEAYAEPVYLNLGKMPASVELVGVFDQADSLLTFEHFELEQPAAMILSATGSLGFGGEEMVMTVAADVDGRFPGFYEGWMKGFLAGTSAADLATSGALKASVSIKDNVRLALDLSLSEFNADDSDARFAFFDAHGEVSWRAGFVSGPSRPSVLRWGGGFLYGIGYGAASLEFLTKGEQFSLLAPTRLPLLDGALVIETLNASDWSGDNPSVEFDAVLEPLDLRELTTTLGWPAFGGSLAGKLPLLRLRDGVVTLAGTMEAQAFDGTIRVDNLRIQQPFSNLPIVSGSVFMEGLDLRLLTDVFTVGHIKGRLDGRIADLQIVQGRPVAFDASFYTPPGDRSKRRISRRALDSLSEIAGGGTALLSSPFLKLFKNFSYRKLGISCRLANGVCQMNGVEKAPNGYYLVKGSSIPRIDVIGHSEKVNWQRLLSQIELAMQSAEDDPSLNEEPQ